MQHYCKYLFGHSFNEHCSHVIFYNSYCHTNIFVHLILFQEIMDFHDDFNDVLAEKVNEDGTSYAKGNAILMRYVDQLLP